MKSKIRSHDRALVGGLWSNGSGGSNGAQQLKPRRTLENELDQAVQRYIELYDFAPVGYVSLDRVGRIEEVNLAAVQMLGRSRRSLNWAALCLECSK